MKLRYKYYSLRGGMQRVKTRTALAISAVTLALSGGTGLSLLAFSSAHAETGGTIVVCDTTCDADSIQGAINSATAGDTISFGGDATLSHSLKLTKSVTIEGNNHTITGDFVKTGSDNNASFEVLSDNVTINNLTVDSTSAANALHGINVYMATGVVLNDVTTQNNGHNGVVVNGSTVTANNITTNNNGWGGIDVDQGTNVTTPAILTVTGVSHHDELGGVDIKVDNTANPDVSVVDTENQYSHKDFGVVRVYTLIDIVSDKNQCKNDGWKTAHGAHGLTFKNQGQCVSYVNHNNGVVQDDVRAKNN